VVGGEYQGQGEGAVFETTEFFASFSVDDLGVAKRFYADTLGLEVWETEAAPEWLRELWLQLAGERRVMIYPKPDHAPAKYTILNFPVNDIIRAVEDLAARGVTMDTFDGFECDAKGIHRVGNHSIAWFRDPAGNVLAIDQEH
jgi:catechol 2,3-dioxygenase-like lactoylglutathione lyase family enzyme